MITIDICSLYSEVAKRRQSDLYNSIQDTASPGGTLLHQMTPSFPIFHAVRIHCGKTIAVAELSASVKRGARYAFWRH